jgi:hypothetical protein
MNNVLTLAEGLSAAIQSIQEEIYTALPAFWEGDIEGFGKVYKNVQNSSDNIPKYYKSSKIFIPEVYNSLKGSYEDVFYDNNKACVFCFLIDDKDSTEDNLVFTTKVKVVFMVNLTMIYPNSIERQDSKSQKDVIQILREINGDYKINEVQRGIDNIFNQYTTSGVKFEDIQPLHSFAVNIDLNYYLTDEINNIALVDTVTNGDTTVINPNLPVVSNIYNRYIQIGVYFEQIISATNNPTSYAVFRLLDGLSFDSVNGIISGTVTGVERLETMVFTATNEFGTSNDKLTFFSLINGTADTFFPPNNISISDLDGNSYILNWVFRPYNKGINGIEIYRNNISKGIVEQVIGGSRSTGIRMQSNVGYENKFKVRFKNEDNLFSYFSNEIFVDYKNDLITLEYNLNTTIENVNNVPFIVPTQIYYIQKDVQSTFDFSKYVFNNPSSYILSSFFGASSNTLTGKSAEIAGSFNNTTGIASFIATGDLFEIYSGETGKVALLTASNINGSAISYVSFRFRFTDIDPNQINAPINVTVNNDDSYNGAYLIWEYTDYNKLIKEVEVYLNNELYSIIINPISGRITGTSLNNISGQNTIKIRVKDEDDLFSGFSSDVVFTV